MRQFLVVHPLGKLPERQTKLSAGYDFYIPERVKIKKRKVETIDTYVRVVMNPDEYLMIVPRSSSFKKGLTLANILR